MVRAGQFKGQFGQTSNTPYRKILYLYKCTFEWNKTINNLAYLITRSCKLLLLHCSGWRVHTSKCKISDTHAINCLYMQTFSKGKAWFSLLLFYTVVILVRLPVRSCLFADCMYKWNEPYLQLHHNEKMVAIWVGLLYRRLLKWEYFTTLEVNEWI